MYIYIFVWLSNSGNTYYCGVVMAPDGVGIIWGDVENVGLGADVSGLSVVVGGTLGFIRVYVVVSNGELLGPQTKLLS